MAKKRLLNLYGCSNELQVPVKWLKEAALSGKIPCLRFGKRDMRFDPEAVSDALARLAAAEHRRPTILGASR